MRFPTDNTELDNIRGTYIKILGQVEERRSRFVKIKVPRVTRTVAPSAPASSGSAEAL